MYRITLLKDLIVAIGTLGALMYVQVGPFNDCASYSLWGRKGLALPGRTDISDLLNERMRSTYPAIAFTSVSIQLLLIPCIILYSHRKALHMLLQSDDGTSQWPNWLKWLRFRRRSARMSTIFGRDPGSDEGEVEAVKDPDVELLPLKAVSDEAIGEVTQCETLRQDFNRVSQSTGSSAGVVGRNLQHSRSLIQYDENDTRRRWTFLVSSQERVENKLCNADLA
jgi:ABC-type multidrug transport system fused ATPase/permease subunit